MHEIQMGKWSGTKRFGLELDLLHRKTTRLNLTKIFVSAPSKQDMFNINNK